MYAGSCPSAYARSAPARLAVALAEAVGPGWTAGLQCKTRPTNAKKIPVMSKKYVGSRALRSVLRLEDEGTGFAKAVRVVSLNKHGRSVSWGAELAVGVEVLHRRCLYTFCLFDVLAAHRAFFG